jgi:5-methyltetrahydrofolate--homocysteine methyltransferase
MKENLIELDSRGLGKKWPVVLGGAALTRSFVEQDLSEQFSGTVRYARDAFEGLKLMDTLMAVKRGVPGAQLPPLKPRRTTKSTITDKQILDTTRSDVATNNPIPTPPFFGSRIVKGIALADYVDMLDERALFLGQWGLKGKDFESMAIEQGRPQLRALLNNVQSKGWLNAAVAYGYFPCVSDGNDLIVLHHEGSNKGEERVRFTFPRQSRDRRLCLADFFRSKNSNEIDVVSFQIVTMGQSISDAITKLFKENLYREYLELHGLSVQLTESLTEYWHARTRKELAIHTADSKDLKEIFNQGYQGSRYSFGYPACPDLEQQKQICELLQPDRIGVSLSEEFQLHPEQSTSSIVLHHPEAKYFNAS